MPKLVVARAVLFPHLKLTARLSPVDLRANTRQALLMTPTAQALLETLRTTLLIATYGPPVGALPHVSLVESQFRPPFNSPTPTWQRRPSPIGTRIFLPRSRIRNYPAILLPHAILTTIPSGPLKEPLRLNAHRTGSPPPPGYTLLPFMENPLFLEGYSAGLSDGATQAYLVPYVVVLASTPALGKASPLPLSPNGVIALRRTMPFSVHSTPRTPGLLYPILTPVWPWSRRTIPPVIVLPARKLATLLGAPPPIQF